MKPLVKWSGGKSDELDKILPHIPEEYDYYIEPFIGGGALFFHLNPNKAIINDVHPDLTNFYNQIKEGHASLIFDMMSSKTYSEEEYYNIRDDFLPETSIDEAFKFYYLRKTCYRGMLRYNSNGKFNIPYGRYKTMNFADLTNPSYEELLKRTDIMNEDFQVVFDRFGSNACNFCFIDQPYDSKFTDYGYCKFDKEDQKRLAQAFKNTSMKCLMVVGDTPFIRSLYDDYIVETYAKKYKFKIHSGRVGDNINNLHLVIKNY